jgi:tRNA 2-thiouridine synthesizing protein D
LKIIFVINESPWGSTLSSTALRIARSVLQANHELSTVFFREDGVYNGVADTANDSDAADLFDSWAGLNEQFGTSLLLCQSSVARRLSAPPGKPFRVAGLVEFVDLVADCDRVMTF